MTMIVRFFLLVISATFFCNVAYAAKSSCTVNNTNIAIEAGNIALGSSDLLGDKLSGVIVGTPSTLLSCTNTSGMNNITVSIGAVGTGGTQSVYDGKIVYPTSISGVGFALGGRSNVCSDEAWAVNSSGSSVVTVCKVTSGTVPSTVTVTPLIQFYRIQDSSGSATSQTNQIIGQAYTTIDGQMFTDSSGKSVKPISLTFTKITKSCSVVNKNISVDMGTVVISGSNPGGTTGIIGSAKPFNINLICDSGSSNASITLSSNNVKFGDLGVIGTDSVTDAATGVGIQILDGDGNAYRLNKVKSLGTVSGSVVLPFKAQYFQIDDTVNPGIANGSANFTITYK